MVGDKPSEVQTLHAVERLIVAQLPPGWSFRAGREPRTRVQQVDVEWSIDSPDGGTATFIVEAKRVVSGGQIDQVLAHLATFEGLPLVAAPYLSQTVRGLLSDRGISYVDATGNVRIVADRPGLFIERQGALRDPWPSSETLQSLRGRGAGRAVRALVDFRPPYGVRDLAERASVPLGSLSRTLDLLDREGLTTRNDRGGVVHLDWEGAVRRWGQDYDFARTNHVAYFLEPRGLGALAAKLTEAAWDYATTGAFAVQHFTPIAPARQVAVYVEDIARTAERLRLRPTDVGANVVLAEPFDPVVFDRTALRDELRIVAPGQLAVDLLTGPGREPSEGNELLAWMRNNEDDWRA